MTPPTTASADERSLEALVRDAQLAEREGRRVDARALYERALRAAPAGADAPAASAVLRWVARTYQVDADFDAALDCLEAALAVAVACGDDAGEGHAINLQANVYVQQGRLDEAECLYEQARSSAVRAGETKLAAMTAQNLGVIANIRGDRERALANYENSLAHYRTLGLPKDVCIALNNLGMLHTELRQWAEAERAYEEAVQLSAALGDLSARILLEVNLAQLWIAQGTHDRARRASDHAAELSHKLGDTHALGEIERSYGIIARETGDHALAETHFAKAAVIATERQDKLLAADVAREQAELHRRQGRSRDALQCLNRAHRLFGELRASHALTDVDRRTRGLEGEFLDVVRRWGDSIESKDRYTKGHSERVADLAYAIATAAGLDERTLFWFRIGALLHDVGKLVVPEEVLNKAGKLTPEEWELIKRHPVAGVEMLKDVEFPWDVLPMVESHHERWDGGGYPHGRSGEDIPYTARILCIADVYDALTSERSYKRAMTHEEAVAAMVLESGRMFDPALLAVFEQVAAESPPALHRDRPTATPSERVARPTPSDAFDTLTWPAHHVDDLTGLPLRRSFLERAAAAVATAAAGAGPASLLVIDVDHFKLVNDTYGHLQGDDVLRAVAGLLRAASGRRNIVARYAGDEFVVLLPNTPLDVAQAFADDLCRSARALECPLHDGAPGAVRVTLSIGCASAPRHGEKVETLFAAADRALYVAKRRGRDGTASAGGSGDDAAPLQPNLDRFVGRVRELRALVRLLESATAGELRVATVIGEAGVGKTALLRQLAPEVRLRGGAMVLGRALEGDVRAPYAPWADVLGALHQLGLVPSREWRELPRLVAELGPGDARDAAPSSGGSKYAVLDEIAEYLRLAAEKRPLVLVLDDMQWADAASWDALDYLLAQLQDGRVLCCLTMRAEDAHGEPDERRRRLSRDERVHQIKLARLTRDEVGEWVDAAIHRSDPSRALAGFVYRQTEGNALFLVQVMRTLVDEGAIRHTGQEWEFAEVGELALPAAITDLIARRLDRLSPQSRAVLVTAAAIGREFDVDLAIAAGAGTEDEMLDAIDEGVTAAVLEPAGERAGDRYAFAHTLLVAAVKHSENPRRLRRVHARVAEAIRARRPDAAAEIAAHYDAAGQSPDAYTYAMLAGSRATAIYAHEEAAALFTTALRHAPGVRSAVETRLRLTQVAETAGRYADAEVQCNALLDDGAPALPAGERLFVSRTRERVRALQGRPVRDTLAACTALLVEAEMEANERERAALLIMISLAHSRLGDVERATEIARQAVALAEQVGDLALIADALARLALMVGETSPPEAVALFERALALYTTLGDRYGQGRCHVNTGIAHWRDGNIAAAEAAYQTGIDLARSAHTPEIASAALLNLGVMYMKSRRDAEARACFDEALHLSGVSRIGLHRLVARYNLAHLARERGSSESALDLYQTAASDAQEFGQLDIELGALAGGGLAALALNRPEVAAAGMQRILAALAARGAWWFQGRELVEALRVRLELLRGTADGAARAFDAAVALADPQDRHSAAWLVAECVSPLARAGVATHWETVERFVEIAETSGWTHLATRCREALVARAREGAPRMLHPHIELAS